MIDEITKPRYPKSMRDRAKADSLGLVTIDVPGMTYQGPQPEKRITALVKLLSKWWEQDRKDGVK